MKRNKLLAALVLMSAGSAFAAGGGSAGADTGGTGTVGTSGSAGASGADVGSQTPSQDRMGTQDMETQGMQQPNQQAIHQIDANRDGNISREEAQTDSQLTSSFQDLDSDEDGQLSAEEFGEWEPDENL